jgi:hypothetical protein
MGYFNNYPSDYDGPLVPDYSALFTDDSVPSDPQINPGEWMTTPSHPDDPGLYQSGYLQASTGEESEGNAILVGASGSGKTRLLLPSIGAAIKTITRSNRNLVVLFDMKGDMLSLAKAGADAQQVPLYFFDISDRRSLAWHLAGDAEGRIDVLRQLVEEILPAPGRSDDEFWHQGAQMVGKAGAQALESRIPGEWGIHDLFNLCFSDLKHMIRFLSTDTRNMPAVSRILKSDSEKAREGILMHLGTLLEPLHLAAAHQYHTPRNRWCSLKQVMATGGVVVISQKIRAQAASRPIMRAMFRTLVNLLLDKLDYSGGHAFVFVDELPFLGRNLPGLEQLLTLGRSKRVHTTITVQAIDQLVQQYGSEGAATIINDCDFITLLRTNSFASARWASQMCGEVVKPHRSYSFSGTSLGVQTQFQRAPDFYPEYFLRLPKPSPKRGLSYVFLSPYGYGPLETTLTGAEVARAQPPRAAIAPRVEKHRDELQLPFYTPGLQEFASRNRGAAAPSKDAFVAQYAKPFERAVAASAYDYLQQLAQGMTAHFGYQQYGEE